MNFLQQALSYLLTASNWTGPVTWQSARVSTWNTPRWRWPLQH